MFKPDAFFRSKTSKKPEGANFVSIENVIDVVKKQMELGKTPDDLPVMIKEGVDKFTKVFYSEADDVKAAELAERMAELIKLYPLPSEPTFEYIPPKMGQINWEHFGSEISENNGSREENLFTRRVNLLFGKILTQYGLNAEEVLASWRKSMSPVKNMKRKNLKPEDQRRITLLNLHALHGLEISRPGSASILTSEFGIMNFGQYPPEMLADQYDNRNDLEHPYGIVLTGLKDYNGSHYAHQSRRPLLSMFKQLKGKYRIRFTESEGRYDVARTLINLDNRYGKKQKISFALVRGHGSKDVISFGDWSLKMPRTDISKDDISQERIGRVRDFFTSLATIIFESCSVGEKDGLGQTIFEKLGLKVVACHTAEAGIKSMEIQEKNGDLNFNVIFNTPGIFFKSSKAVKYE